MPLSDSGQTVLTKLQTTYGDKHGKSVFSAMQNAGRLKRSKMEGRSRSGRSRSR